MRFWRCWKALKGAIHWQMQASWIAGSEKAREDKVPRSQLIAGAWNAQVHWVNQAWRTFCFSCTPTLFSSGSITAWRAMKRFFVEFFSFFFDNISRCYLVFVSLFPSFKLYIIDNGWIQLRVVLSVVCAHLLLFCT